MRKIKCYLIRHGITEGNKSLNFNGCRTDEPLSEEGRARLISIDGVPGGAMLFTSPMKRAVETASIMLPGKKPEIIEELKEMDFGIFEGKNHKELDGDPEYQAWLDSGGRSGIPGGDSLDGFMKRTGAGFREAMKKAAAEGAETVYVVAHGGTIMSLMHFLTHEDYFNFNLPNGAGYEIDLEVDDEGNILAAISYDRFCGGLRNGSGDWRPPQYTPSDKVDR
ncbi:MAG: histidine phosphatase family protein [Mogibacterium sp.]|nr:histidine phosphatase family protein [Mogibacterium sp.]